MFIVVDSQHLQKKKKKCVPRLNLKSGFGNFNLMQMAHPNDTNHLFHRTARQHECKTSAFFIHNGGF